MTKLTGSTLPRQCAMQRARQRGATLPAVTLLIAALACATLGSAQQALLERRLARADEQGMRAFHVADAALAICAADGAQWVDQSVVARAPSEPVGWRAAGAFDGAAPLAHTLPQDWRGSVRAPQCLIERWVPPQVAGITVTLFTARGFGATLASQAWLQRLEISDAAAGTVVRRWRRLAQPPA